MLKLRSFRLRIALLSTVLAGSAVIGFGITSWLFIYDAKLNRLDSEMRNQLFLAFAPPPQVMHWENYASSLPATFGLTSKDAVALQVITPDGQTLYQSDQWSPEFKPDRQPPVINQEQIFPPGEGGQPQDDALPLPPARPIAPEEIPHQFSPPVTRNTATGSWRLKSITSPSIHVAIAVNLQTLDGEMSAIRNVFLIAVPIVLLLVAVGAWGLSGSALTPLQEVTATIRRVTVQGLDERIPIATSDVEFLELLQVFNQMMERLERSFKQASRFSADAAHELKTPLAILQGELERTLQQVDAGSEVQQRLTNLLDEVRRLGSIVRKLLLLSLADAGQMRFRSTKVNLSEILTNLVEDIDLLAPHLEVQRQIPATLWVKGDQDLLTQVLQNLISNAIKYNLPQGWIRIEAHHQPKTILVKISNSSLGIPKNERDRIFDRFHRGNMARNHQIEGLGLGLSLSREIARAHGGELSLDHSSNNLTTFVLRLPV